MLVDDGQLKVQGIQDVRVADGSLTRLRLRLAAAKSTAA
jgi:hypothetical protein